MNTAPTLRKLLHLFLILSPGVFLLLENTLFPLSFLCRRSMGVFFVTGIAATVIASALIDKRPRATAFLLLPCTLLVLAASSAMLALAFCVFLLIASLFIASFFTASTDQVERPALVASLQFRMVGGGLLLCFLLGRIPELIPPLRYVPDSLAGVLSRVSNIAQGTEISISSGAWGLYAFLLVLCMGAVVACCLPQTRRQAIGLLLCFMIPLGLLPFLPIHFDHGALYQAGLMAGFWTMALAVLGIQSYWICHHAVASQATTAGTHKTTRYQRHAYVLVSLVGIIVGCVLTSADVYLSSPANKVLVHNRGGLDWDVATYDQPFAGMFGQLPKYAVASGVNFDVLDQDAIAASDLIDINVLILINSSREWEQTDRTVIFDFVRRGGSLLVLGDHTDVFGLQESFNQLLGETGISIRFDSAYHGRSSWKQCMVASSGALESRWEIDDPGISIGASLSTEGWARPLLTGRYGFSDTGVRENHVGSYLGNYSFDDGERLGDLHLVAQRNLGLGRIVVFGDTSTFQGGLSTRIDQTVAPLFNYLCRPAAYSERNHVRVMTGSLVVGLCLVLLLVRPDSHLPLLLGSTLFLTFGFGQGLAASNQSFQHPIDRSTVLIGSCQMNRVGHYHLSLNAIGSLYSSMLKSGFRVAELKHWDDEKINDSRAICFVAPQRAFSDRQVDSLHEYQKQGGVVVLAAGFEDLHPVQSLLDEHQLTLENRPLGKTTFFRQRTKANRQYPRVYDGWPIASTNGVPLHEREDVDVLLTIGNETVVVYAHHDQGGLLFFADSRFFSSQNIEHFPSFKWEGNIEFVKQLCEKYLDAKPDLVKPSFPSPEKPQ